jgi:hypothetical protein
MGVRSDSFNRVDSGVSLGTPDDAGSAWVALSGTWGISTNRGAALGTADGLHHVAYLESNLSDAVVSVTFPVITSTAGFAFRISDNNNYLFFQVDSASRNLVKRAAGAFTQIGGPVAGTTANGDVFMARLQGSLITIYQNGLPILSVTETFNQTATKHGLKTFTGDSSLYDDFTVASTLVFPLVKPLVRSLTEPLVL